MKVLFVASECTPIAKVGGLGDVIGALPKSLLELGCDVRIALPKYKVINEKEYPLKLVASGVKVFDQKVMVFQTPLPQSKVLVYLLENKKYFGQNDIYFERSGFVGSFKEIQRFLFFSQAVLNVLPFLNWQPDILHCNDWHTAIVALLLKNIKTLLTIHNLANQGKCGAKEVFDFLGFKAKEEGEFNILKQGILNADILSTVSPGYSKEIQTEEFGEGLEKEFLKRKKDLYGILNGIDNSRFNPEIDSCLKKNYSLKNLDKKIENKIHLQEILKFKQNPKVPLIGFIGRLTFQKGIDLIIKVAPELVEQNCQMVVLGVGEKHYEQELSVLSQLYPKNISVNIKFDALLAQKIYAGSDIFLMPSRFEPCGLGQLISMAYGNLPLVRKTGGLADTVENGKTGFVFEKYSQHDFLSCLKKALEIYQDRKKWQKLMRNAMKKDFSWQNSAQKYLNLYKKLL